MSRMTHKTYDLGRHADACHATGQAFQPGDAIVVALAEREQEDGLDRFDYALDAWSDGTRPERLFAYWQTEMPEPGQTNRPLIEQGESMALFEALEDADDPKRVAFRALLAIELIRRKRLIQVGREPGVLLVRSKEDAPESPPTRVLDMMNEPEILRGVTEMLGPLVSSDA